ncbi:universal stress protein [Hymenobacter latericus]|uniref:universal stress protein n=1 Tax=Hymenobacter sp. YIM 151858-1 TaxID=2987688 RepID=UPI0022260B93|nr:universal stress protein [Hymenobacter sp. YIM 151858-1]UYZ59704.1 universal stress protein [Hymenobacter sp. YIM 151858-1]
MPQLTAQPKPAKLAAPLGTPLSLIVLTNFFPAAHRAIRYAAELAAPLGAQLVLLHVRQAPALADDDATGPEWLHDAHERDGELLMALNALADEVYVPTSVELVPSLQPDVALDLAKRYQPALFVVGRAATELAELSAAVLQVLRTGRFPVLLVPETYRGTSCPTQVAIAADGDAFRLDDAATGARQLLAELEPDLTVVNVSIIETDDYCLAARYQVEQSGLCEGARQVHTRAFQHLSTAHGLLQAVEATKADLLVLIARRHSVLGELFQRSVTDRLMQLSPVPVLVLPAHD